jgi:hypothetical protein
VTPAPLGAQNPTSLVGYRKHRPVATTARYTKPASRTNLPRRGTVLCPPSLRTSHRSACRDRITSTAILCQKVDEAVHAVVVGRIIDEATFLARIDEVRVRELLEMKRQRRGGHVKALCYRARCQSNRPLLY